MKRLKKIINIILFFSILYICVDAQYYYFSEPTNSNWYQQGCQEQLEVRFNTDWKKTVWWIFHLILDDSKISYVTWWSLSSLLFKWSTLWFPDWVPTFPKRKAWSNYTILETERYNASNPTSTVNWNKPYGYVIFIPKYSWSIYTVDFGMSYISWYTWTTETTLSYDWVDIINPSQQVLYLTWTIDVQQKPCVNDSSGPSIVDNIYTNWATKISNSWLNISLFDSNGQWQVPFVWKNWERTWNLWSINNQYWIDTGTINIHVSWNNHFVDLNHTNFDVEPLTFKTWQDLDRDYTITLNHLELFDFWIEKQIYITYFAKDRVWNTTETSISFNKPKEPRLTQVSPSNGQSHITYDANISFNMHDDRAWVDSGSIVVIFSWIWNAFYAEYYSGDLSFEAISWDANIDDYKVVLQSHLEFPTNSDISMIIYWYDLAWNWGQLYNWQFLTKPSCSDLWCCDVVKIKTWYELGFIYYPNSVLYVSGWINPYFYLDWNTWYINCNLQNSYLSLYKWNWEDLTGTLVWLSNFHELNIMWNNIRARLSWNTLFLEKMVTTWYVWNNWHGWAWWSTIVKDNCCVNWWLPWWNELCEDHSDSYYDWTCEWWYHWSADICGVNQSNHPDELKIAYLYAYNYGITTLCPIRESMLDGYLYRNHFAKMISEYAVNVVWKTPNIWKEWCDSFQDIEDDTEELKYFMKTACELDLMWLRADWKTPKNKFDPHDIVTRAEFGTVFSRLLFGDKYNVQDESLVYKEEWYWYRDHLAWLKSNWIMTKIDWDRPKYQERRWRVMLMMLRADNFWVFAGKVPALIWIKSLFE